MCGCASIIDGTTQRISASTTPSGARCTFWRNGGLVADIASTPGSVTIEKSKVDLFIVCDKPGFTPATYVNKSGLAMATYANVLTLGLAWAVDSSRGADNKYESQVTLALSPSGMPAPIEAVSPPVAPMPAAAAPRQAPVLVAPAPVAPVAAPAAPQLNCAFSDGSRIRVNGMACPMGWAPAR
jgi:hypothetical protein